MGFVLDNAKYLPTYVTNAEVRNLAVGRNSIADIRKNELKGKILKVEEIATDIDVKVSAKFKSDLESLEEANTVSLNHTAKFNLFCWSNFYLELYNAGATTINNFAYRHGYWLLKPTIADKILFNVNLTEEEKALAEKYDLTWLVENGSLPIPLDTLIKRTFKVKSRKTITWHGDIPAGGVDIGKKYSPVGTILVLESVAMGKPPADTYTTALQIKVDEHDFHELRAQAMSGSTYDVPLFVPAIDSFALRLITNMTVHGYNMRYTFATVKLTDYLGMMLGIIPSETKPDVYERIRTGLGPE